MISPILAQCSICLGGVRFKAFAIIVALSIRSWSNRTLVVAMLLPSTNTTAAYCPNCSNMPQLKQVVTRRADQTNLRGQS